MRKNLKSLSGSGSALDLQLVFNAAFTSSSVAPAEAVMAASQQPMSMTAGSTFSYRILWG